MPGGEEQVCRNQDGLWEELAAGVERYQPRRTQRYLDVNVLLLYWKDSDLPSAKDAGQLTELFQRIFNYRVHHYEIPSEDSGRSLNYHLAGFLNCYGGADNLILIHYGGHGGPLSSEPSAFLWAANVSGGPDLDWSIIQPQLYTARCDIAIFLDCCFAGKAVRPYYQHCMEFLAATDKDQFTPSGNGKFLSFTTVLINEIVQGMQRNGVVRLPDLQRRMVEAKAGLIKQPFYVSISEGSAGKIQLRRKQTIVDTAASDTQTAFIPFERETSKNLVISMFRPLDSTSQDALLRWMTRDSPDAIKDIRLVTLVEKGLTEARAVNDFGGRLLGVDQAFEQAGPPILSDQSRIEMQRLFSQFKDAALAPTPRELSDDEALRLINVIKERSDKFIMLMEDCLAGLEPQKLKRLADWDLSEVKDLRSRLSMRLTLLEGSEFMKPATVIFDARVERGHRFRMGRQANIHVLVEYRASDTSGVDEAVKARQVARVSALLAEPKPAAFRTLPGRGYLQETLHGQRFGFIFEIPQGTFGCDWRTLSDIIKEGRTVPLDARIRMSRMLCDAILHLHSVGWFHKSIKSENVLFFTKEARSSLEIHDLPHRVYRLDEPFLVGFDFSRPSEAETRGTVDFSFQDNLYRHPERWGRTIRFERHHDLYALGILLYEIGRWRLLPTMDSKRRNFEYIRDPEKLRDTLLGSAYAQLAHAAGTKYADAARVCFERRNWSALKEWQYQRAIRTEVLGGVQPT